MRRSAINPRALLLVALVMLAASDGLLAARERRHIDRITASLELDGDGTLLIENTSGSVIISGGPGPGMSITADKLVLGIDERAVAEGRANTKVVAGGDRKRRIIKTFAPPVRSARWLSSVTYRITVPRTVHLLVGSSVNDQIRITNITGNVFVRSVNGSVQLIELFGPIRVDTVNAGVAASFSTRPRANTAISTINGQIEVRLPFASNFDWIAETLGGQILTAFPLQAQAVQTGAERSYRVTVNGPYGPSIRTASMTGRVFLMPIDAAEARTRLVLGPVSKLIPSGPEAMQTAIAANSGAPSVAPAAPGLRQATFNGNFNFAAPMGNLHVGYIRGDARVKLGAGEVEFGRVSGNCDVQSEGGPLTFGDIAGELDARTSAGNVIVRNARKGGGISTEGGDVLVYYAGAAMDLYSGGGDITVRQVTDDIVARTKSGDIFLNYDPGVRRGKITAGTVRGGIVLNVPPGFGADVDATILSRTENGNSIVSNLPGLTITREKVNDRTRIRATGKLNGGGEKVVLTVEDGDIQIRAGSFPHLLSVPAR